MNWSRISFGGHGEDRGDCGVLGCVVAGGKEYTPGGFFVQVVSVSHRMSMRYLEQVVDTRGKGGHKDMAIIIIITKGQLEAAEQWLP